MILQRSLKHVFQKSHRSKSTDLAIHSFGVTGQFMNLGNQELTYSNSNDILLLTLCAGRQLVTTNALFTQRIALRRLGDTHALIIGIKLILSSSDKKTDHALLKSKVSISFQLKRQHQRVQGTKKLDVAKLANSDTQDTLRDNVSSAMEDLVDRH